MEVSEVLSKVIDIFFENKLYLDIFIISVYLFFYYIIYLMVKKIVERSSNDNGEKYDKSK